MCVLYSKTRPLASQYKICINGNTYSKNLKTLNDNNFKKKVISRTLCMSQIGELPTTVQDPLSSFKTLPGGGPRVETKHLWNELQLGEQRAVPRVFRGARERQRRRPARRVQSLTYTSPIMYSVCHMSDSDTLLVCSGEEGPDGNWANWLVALSRNGSEWREAQRMQTGGDGWICCVLTDSRVLIGNNSTYMELFRVESGPRVARVHRIHVPEQYDWFSATSGSDTLVAMTFQNPDQSVRVHRLRGDRLEELARIRLECSDRFLWLADRLLVAELTERSSRTPS